MTTYFPVKPKLIDKNRRENGDYYKKPTQYWFVNCEPENNLVFEALDYVPMGVVEKSEKLKTGWSRKVARSLIHPQYADRFIRQYILDQNGG